MWVWEWEFRRDSVVECLRDREAESRAHSTERQRAVEHTATQHRETNERELKFEWSENAWESLGPLGFVIKFKRCVLHLFFWILAWIGSFARYGSSWRESAPFISSLSRVGVSREEKKKKTGRGTDVRAAASFARRRVRPHWTRVLHGFCYVRASQSIGGYWSA